MLPPLEIDALTRVSFSLAENKGVFALLLGSGVSRSAEIATGWEITLDLIRRIALLEGETEQQDWSAWYSSKYSKAPDYSALLEALATTATERRSIIHGYVEASADDREKGRRLPTQAHRSIARLVRGGYIRVIITTNFDRLLESALRDEGVEPTVISSADTLAGAEPASHANCLLLKLHGDYKDARILNTDAELSSYPPGYDRLLDQILDEYGLILAGWSGEWDHALRAAILRAPSRRYPLFWATRGDLGARALELVAARKATPINVADADSFFAALDQNVATIERSRRRNPVGVELLIGSAKRLLSSPQFRIELDDLISGELDRLIELLQSMSFPPHGAFSNEEFARRVEGYEAASEPLSKAFFVLGRWGNGSEFARVLDALRSVHSFAESEGNGLVVWLGLRSYPAVLLLAAYSIGLIVAKRWDDLHNILVATLPRADKYAKRVVDALHLWDWKGGDNDFWKHLPGLTQRHTPLSDHLVELLGAWSAAAIGRTAIFESQFAQFEILAACAQLEKEDESSVTAALASPEGKVRMSVGRFGWHSESRRAALEEITSAKNRTSLIAAGFAKGSATFFELFLENVARLANWMERRW